MTEKELSRSNIIQSLINGSINDADASKQIGVSIRHIKRLKSRVDKYGEDGLIHKSRGRTSNRKLDSVIVKKAKKHLKEKYYDFGPTLAAEKLDKADNIKLGKEAVRGIMIRTRLS